MVPSPRKRAPRAPFNQTWDDTDAAYLDPNSLPVARIPRGWERKQETKKTEEGREKKIWRRFDLRSRAADATAEEEDADEHDARSRAVKKQQHMSPKAMEKTTSRTNGKKRTFKATRWDRRKSVLPRKNTRGSELPMTDVQDAVDESDDAQDATGVDIDEESFAHVDSVVEPRVEPTHNLLPEREERRGTFTFTMDAETIDDLPDYESLDGLEEDGTLEPNDATPAEDATLARLFQSPAKKAPTQPFNSPEKIAYPQLPHNDREEVCSEPSSKLVDVEEVMDDHVLEAEVEEVSVDEKREIAADEAALPRGLELQEVESNDAVAQGIETATTSVSASSSNVDPSTELPRAFSEVTYPALPPETSPSHSAVFEAPTPLQELIEVADEDADMSEITPDMYADPSKHEEIDVEDDVVSDNGGDDTAGEEFTEASLQLNIQRDYEETLRGEHPELPEASQKATQANSQDAIVVCQDGPEEVAITFPETFGEDDQVLQDQDALKQSPVKEQIEDITDGLTLSFTPAKVPSADPTPRKLHSPPPPLVQPAPDDVTMTIALDDDTALLKDFLNRAAASKAEKAAVLTHRRESLQNRRDSDVIRHALASPRKVLEEKDPNSPSKYDNELTLDLSQTLTLNIDNNALASPSPDQADDEGTTGEKSLRGSRRSSRTKKSRLPAPASAGQAQAQASKIAIRRADGTEHVVLKKSDAQELSTLTRTNTRKNKQGAFGVTVRLLKLAVDAASLPPLDESTKELIIGKNIRWNEQLAYYQENPETVAEAESLATPDELGMPDPASTPNAKPKSKVSKSSTPKIRRVRGLGTANGTPGKGLLAPASLLPEAVQEEKEAAQAPVQQLPRPKAGKVKKMLVAPTTTASSSTPSDTKLPSLDIAPVGVEPPKERKSRLAAPKKVMLPQPAASLPAEGKENTQRTGIGGATPKKGIPAPKIIVPPTMGMESGLPRRRGRKY